MFFDWTPRSGAREWGTQGGDWQKMISLRGGVKHKLFFSNIDM